ELARNLHQRQPQEIAWQDLLAAACTHAGSLALTHRKQDLAEKLLHEGWRLLEPETGTPLPAAPQPETGTQPPTTLQHEMILALNYLSRGVLCLQTERLEQAQSLLRRAIALAEEQARDQPKALPHRNNLAQAHRHLATLYRKTGRTAEAEEHQQKAVTLYEE